MHGVINLTPVVVLFCVNFASDFETIVSKKKLQDTI